MTSSSPLSTNASLPSSDISVYQILQNCIDNPAGTSIFITFTVICVLLLLPLCIFVLFLWYRQYGCRLKTGHIDVFTYHVVVLELLTIFGTMLMFCGIYIDLPYMRTLGVYLYTINLPGQMFFHILTCLERFLAVVHPITYRILRTAKGVRLRNMTVSAAWLSTLAWTVLLITADQVTVSIISFCITSVFLIIVSSCSVSVLCVLIRPGPGEVGGKRRVDQSKIRALYTILAILAVLLFRFGGSMLSTSLFADKQMVREEMCVVWLSVVWFFLPSRFLLPLLFLQRVGKLCCKKRNDAD